MTKLSKIEELRKNTERAKNFFDSKVAFTVGPVELKRMIETEPEKIQLIDVRSSDDFIHGRIPEAISIPASNLDFSMDKLSKDKINILYCYDQQCHLAAKCAGMIAEEGFPVMELEGGYSAWLHKDYDIVTSE